MAEFAQFGALCVALVSFCLSLAAILIQYAKRAQNPLTAPLETEIQSLRLAQADVIDRVDQFMRRDRTRRLRAEKAEEPDQVEPVDPKAQLRALARQRGMIR